MTTVTVRQHTRRKPDRLERDPFRSEIKARKEALERRVRKPDDWYRWPIVISGEAGASTPSLSQAVSSQALSPHPARMHQVLPAFRLTVAKLFSHQTVFFAPREAMTHMHETLSRCTFFVYTILTLARIECRFNRRYDIYALTRWRKWIDG